MVKDEFYLNKGLYMRMKEDNRVLGLFNHAMVDDCVPIFEGEFYEEMMELFGEENKKSLGDAVKETQLSFRQGLKIARALRGGNQVYASFPNVLANERDIKLYIFSKECEVKVAHVWNIISRRECIALNYSEKRNVREEYLRR